MFKRIFKFFKHEPPKPVLPEPTRQELNIICVYADGNPKLRDSAIGVYRKYIHRKDLPEIRFMGEVDNSHPDLLLRATYRKQLLSAIEH